MALSKLFTGTVIKYFYVIITICLTGCANNSPSKDNTAIDSTTFATNDTVPELRTSVNSKPVASWLVPISDPKLDQKFGVNIYETPHTFRYLLHMQHGGMRITDTLKVPNFGTWPVIQIKAGKEKLSCIIGFLDKERQFKEYKMLTGTGNKLKLIVLKKYSTGRYRNIY